MDSPVPKSELPSQPQGNMKLGILQGVLLTLALHLLACLLLFLLLGLPPIKGTKGDIADVFFYFFGFIQLLYMVPVINYFNRRGRNGAMIGLVIGAALTFLIGLPYAFAWIPKPIIRDGSIEKLII